LGCFPQHPLCSRDAQRSAGGSRAPLCPSRASASPTHCRGRICLLFWQSRERLPSDHDAWNLRNSLTISDLRHESSLPLRARHGTCSNRDAVRPSPSSKRPPGTSNRCRSASAATIPGLRQMPRTHRRATMKHGYLIDRDGVKLGIHWGWGRF
jgi:hypothetical protein